MKMGTNFSAFYLFHTRHVKIHKGAKYHYDYSIVGLQTDLLFDRLAENKPAQKAVECYIQLKSCKLVLKFFTYVVKRDLKDILRSFKIDVCLVGD